MPKTKKNPNPTPAFLQLDEGISAIFVEGEQIGTVHCWRETDLHQVEIWEITKPLSVFTDAATRSIEFQHADPKGQQGKTREGELLQGAATGVQPTFWHRRDLVYVGELPAPDPDDLGEVRWVLVDHGDGPQLSGAQLEVRLSARKWVQEYALFDGYKSPKAHPGALHATRWKTLRRSAFRQELTEFDVDATERVCFVWRAYRHGPVPVVALGSPQLDEGVSGIAINTVGTVGQVHSWKLGTNSYAELWEIGVALGTFEAQAASPWVVTRQANPSPSPKIAGQNRYAALVAGTASSPPSHYYFSTVSYSTTIPTSLPAGNGIVREVWVKLSGASKLQGYMFQRSSGNTRTDDFLMFDTWTPPQATGHTMTLVWYGLKSAADFLSLANAAGTLQTHIEMNYVWKPYP